MMTAWYDVDEESKYGVGKSVLRLYFVQRAWKFKHA